VPAAERQAPGIEKMMETALALGAGGGVEMLRELVAIHRDTVREDANRQMIHAVAAFRAECPQLQRTKGVEPKATPEGTKYKRHYTPFDEMERVLLPIATKHGLSWTFDATMDDKGRNVVTFTLWHVSGASRSNTVTMPTPAIPNANDSQRTGGALTYGMRYAMLMGLGMATADDDDGANDPGEVDLVTDKQAANLQALVDELGAKLNKPAFLKYYGADQLSEIPQARYADAVAALERKRDA
jgi:hypothetical protein